MFEAPEIIRKIPDIEQIYKIGGKQIDNLNEVVSQIDNDIYFEEMSIARIERWESILSIVASDNDSVEDRRFRIQSKILERPPYTFRILLKKLRVLSPEAEIQRGNGHIAVNLEYTTLKMITEIERMFEEMLPLNVTYKIVIKRNIEQKIFVAPVQLSYTIAPTIFDGYTEKNEVGMEVLLGSRYGFVTKQIVR